MQKNAKEDLPYLLTVLDIVCDSHLVSDAWLLQFQF